MKTLRLLLLTSLALAPIEARSGDLGTAGKAGSPVAGEAATEAPRAAPSPAAAGAPARPIWGERRTAAPTGSQPASLSPGRPLPHPATPPATAAPGTPAQAASARGESSAAAAGAARKPRPPGICERELARAAEKYEIPLQILYAVALTESGTGSGLQPLMLHIEGKDHIPATLPEALRLFHEANGRGVKLIDIGCMQVNWYWHRHEFNSLEEIFDPRLNVEQGARFLKVLRKRHGSWTMAAARYNAGPKNTVAQHRYVCRVMKNLVAAGVGQWTGTAEAFCAAPPVPAEAVRAE